MNKIATFLLSAAIMVGFLIGCTSVPKEIQADLTAAELTQRAQEYLDSGNYDAAELYYQTLMDRFGTDMSVCVSAEFEIAHLKIKDNKPNEARPLLEKILSYYETDTADTLPPEYRKLAQNDLDRISTESGN